MLWLCDILETLQLVFISHFCIAWHRLFFFLFIEAADFGAFIVCTAKKFCSAHDKTPHSLI